MESITIDDIYLLFINNESLNTLDIGDNQGEDIIAVRKVINNNSSRFYALTKHLEIYKINYFLYNRVALIIHYYKLIPDNQGLGIYTVGDTFKPFLNIKKIILEDGTIGIRIFTIDHYGVDAGEINKNHPFYTDTDPI